MKQHTLSLWLGGVLFGLLTSAAQAEPWTLEHTLTEAQRYSAELSASRNEAQALDAMADSATQLPDPKLKFGIENVPVQGSNDSAADARRDDHAEGWHHAKLRQLREAGT